MIYFLENSSETRKGKTQKEYTCWYVCVCASIIEVKNERKNTLKLRHVKMDYGILYINLLFDYTNIVPSGA